MIAILSIQHTGTWSLIKALELLTGEKCALHIKQSIGAKLIHAHARDFEGGTIDGFRYFNDRGYKIIVPIRDPLQSIITRYNRHPTIDSNYLIDGFEGLARINQSRYLLSKIALCKNEEEHNREISRIAKHFGLKYKDIPFEAHNVGGDDSGLRQAYQDKDMLAINTVLSRYTRRLRASASLIEFLIDNNIKPWWMKNKKMVVPAGIGDLVWILKTMRQSGHDFEICKGKPRAWQLLDLVPSLVDSYKQSNHNFSYEDANITQANRHLEEGNRLDDFTGAMHTLPLQTSQYKKEAAKLLRRPKGYKVVGIYASSLKHAWVAKGQAWQPSMWVDLIDVMHRMNPKCCFVLIGAEYDTDMAHYITEHVAEGIDIFDCVGSQHLGVSLEIIKRLDGFIGFPSGMPILAHELNIPTIMFFPKEARHYKMHNTFNRKGSIEDGTWKGCTFPSIKQIINWMQLNPIWKKIIS